MPEGGLSELFYLLSDAPVECRKRLALLENPIQQPLPFCPAGVEFLVAHGVVASRAVLELEEQEAVEEPVFRAVGKPVYDIGPEFIDRPVQPVAAALVDQSQILNSGRPVALLGGGFAGRVKLAYFLSIEKAQPTIFVFDEPTTGLHFHDIKKLLEAFEALISRGHTIIIIEHNMDVIKCADHVIDLGPEGGNMGGNLVIAGTPEEVAACAASYTGQFLREKLAMDSPD